MSFRKPIYIQVRVINCCYIFSPEPKSDTQQWLSLFVTFKLLRREDHSPFSPSCLNSLLPHTSKTPFLNRFCANLASQCTWVVQETLHSTLTQFQWIKFCLTSTNAPLQPWGLLSPPFCPVKSHAPFHGCGVWEQSLSAALARNMWVKEDMSNN